MLHRRGKRFSVHDRETPGAAGEGDVQRPKTLLFFVDDLGGLDHHDAVQFEALDHADRNNSDPELEARSRCPSVLDAGSF